MRDYFQGPFNPGGSLAGFYTLRPADAIFLGAPLVDRGSATDHAIEARCSDLRTAIAKLKPISARDALILLRSSFSAPKLLHTLRCTPCEGHPLLTTHDHLLRESVSAICNSHLGDFQWIQASLPVREGGLGIRRVSSLALSAFFASATSTSELQTLILLNCPSGVDNRVHDARVRWSSINKIPCPATSDPLNIGHGILLASPATGTQFGTTL